MPFIRHKQRAVTSVSPVKGQGRWINPSKGRGGIDFFVDGGFPDGGDGSVGSPWDDFTEINLMSADDLKDKTIGLKAGSTIPASLIIPPGTIGLTVQRYGSGANPIIDGSAVSGTWALDAGLGTGTNIWTWSIDSTMTGSPSITIDGVRMWPVGSSALMEATDLTLFRNVAVTKVRNDAGIPSGQTVINAAALWCIVGASTTNLTITDIDTRYGADNIRLNDGCKGLTITGGVHKWSGAPNVISGGAGVSEAMNIKGVSLIDRSGGVVVRNVEIGETGGHGTEIAFLDNALFTGMTSYRTNFWGLELWQGNINCVFENWLHYDSSNGLAIIINTAGAGVQTDNIFRNVAMRRTVNIPPAPVGQNFEFQNELGGGMNFVINCSFYIDMGNNQSDGFRVREAADLGDNGLMFQNCILQAVVSNSFFVRYLNAGSQPLSTATPTVETTDNNLYFAAAQTGKWEYAPDVISTNLLTEWQVATGTPDLNAAQGDPLFNAPGASVPDLRLTAGSPAFALGNQTFLRAPIVDIDGNPRTGLTNTAGAYENAVP